MSDTPEIMPTRSMLNLLYYPCNQEPLPFTRKKNQMRIISIIFVAYFLAGCSDSAPRDKLLPLYPTFYMKTVDQDGLPVADAEIIVRHGGNSLFSKNSSGRVKYVSDTEGFISIKVDSRQISFDGISKPGYSINLPKILFEYYKTRTYAVPAQGDLWPVDWERFSRESPFIIPAWRIDDSERRAKCNNGYLRERLNADGRSYGIDLLKPSKEAVVEGANERVIQISFNRENDENFNSKYRLNRKERFNQRWRYSISVANGGLKEILPEVLYKKLPPRLGYSKKWELENDTFHARSNVYGGSNSEDDRYFFVRLNDGYYARLSIRFKPGGSGRSDFQNGEIYLHYSVNISGSRYVRGIDNIERARRGARDQKESCVGPL